MAGEVLARTSAKQRLVVCLDGTWNNRDDCTNVLHAFNLVHEGAMADGVVQHRYYDEGVGTGMLDKVSGGAFGNGLEGNVRQAYDWLVEHYNDGDDVFVLGFSRGAFTARSLVGFIARCGLLFRGAPLTVRQLWQGYGELQREKEGSEGFWDRSLKKHAFRQLESLKSDPGAKPAWQREDLNDTERLLVAWSRRIPIRFVGIFDTVGALGLDALAIPGLRGRAGRVHNMRPTSLVQRCCHALALDEHRSSFGHTPILQWLGCGAHPPEHRAAPERDDADGGQVDWNAERAAWEQETQRWRQRYEQRWFVGAHANVGGGYEDNPLARIPLAWLLVEANGAGLACDVPAVDRSAPLPRYRDSFGEFAKWWTWLARGRRFYRPLAPGPEVRAARAKPGATAGARPGFLLEPINERVDESVWAFARANPDYAPPPLIAYAKTRGLGPALSDPERALIAERPIDHEWPAPVAGGWLIIVAWAILAGVGWTYADDIFLVQPVHKVWIGTGVACLAGVVDWGESRLRLTHAVRRHFAIPAGAATANATFTTALARAAADTLYWLRAVGVVLVVIGAIGLLWRFFSLGWRAAAGYQEALGSALEVLALWWPLPVCAVATTVLVALADWLLGPVNGPPLRQPIRPLAALRALDGSVGAGAAIVSFCLLLAVIGQTWRRIWVHVGDAPAAPVTEFPRDVLFAGHFLLLVVLLACFCNTLLWAGDPMRRANLGSMAQLQGRLRFGLPLPPYFSGAYVGALLRYWVDSVRVRWEEPARAEAAAVRSIQRVAGESLWRDCIGLIPVYSLVFAFGLWFAAHDVGFAWLATDVGGLPAWLWIAGATALADWTETVIHLGYLHRTDPGGRAFLEPPAPLVAVAGFATIVKLAGFLTASLTTVAATAVAGVRLFQLDCVAGWRGFVASCLVALACLVAAWLVYCLVSARSERRRNERRSRSGPAPLIVRL